MAGFKFPSEMEGEGEGGGVSVPLVFPLNPLMSRFSFDCNRQG